MVGPFSTAGTGAQVQGERVKRKDLVRGPLADLYGSAYARAYSRGRVQGVGEAFLFPGDIYLGDAGGRRGPHFA